MNTAANRTAYLLRKVERFAEAGNVELRPYQQCAMEAVTNRVLNQLGLSIIWIFPRQSGKDEALAIEVEYLLALYKNLGAEMVFFNPTFKPQTETSMRRLEDRLVSNRLLVVNEAQDVGIAKFDKDILPMVASTHATRLFAGTRWTSHTLLERQYQMGLAAQEQDGLRRVFLSTGEDVRKVVPVYGESVDAAIAELGRQHPLVKTQFFCETVDAQAGMFPPGRQALIRGSHAARTEAEPGKLYGFLIDVAGQDELKLQGKGGDGLGEVREKERDSTFLKIVEVDTSSVSVAGKPTYRVVFRMAWKGTDHVTIFGALKAMEQKWHPRYIVIDATGVGEGLWAMLDSAYGDKKVLPVKFTAPVKSALGYGLIGMMDGGRYQEYHPLDETFQRQLDYCRSEILPGPGQTMRWGVPDGTRDRASGEMVHDDDLITSALCTILDKMEWYISTGPTIFIHPRDPLLDMDRHF